MHLYIGESRITYPMVIMRYKGRCRASSNILIREAGYDTIRDRTVLPLCQTNTAEKEMRRSRILHNNNNTFDHDGYRLNPDSS